MDYIAPAHPITHSSPSTCLPLPQVITLTLIELLEAVLLLVTLHPMLRRLELTTSGAQRGRSPQPYLMLRSLLAGSSSEPARPKPKEVGRRMVGVGPARRGDVMRWRHGTGLAVAAPLKPARRLHALLSIEFFLIFLSIVAVVFINCCMKCMILLQPVFSNFAAIGICCG